MSDIIRFGVSIEQDLLENYDRLFAERGYATRSEALRDLIREALIQEKIEMKSETNVLGSLTLVYDPTYFKLPARRRKRCDSCRRTRCCRFFGFQTIKKMG